MTERIEKLRDSLHGEFSRTGPMTEREQAQKYLKESHRSTLMRLMTNGTNIMTGDEFSGIVAAYAALRVREELEAACKAVCAECESGTPLDDGDCEHYFGFRWMRRDCPAAPIRKRISELAGSEEGSRNGS